jgi:FtsZ-binding cell division protein ZapB
MNTQQHTPQNAAPQSARSDWRSRGLKLLKVLLALAVVYVVHAVTIRWAEPELEAKKVRIRALRVEVKELGRRVESSRVRQKMAERQVEVLRQANNLLRQEESNRQAEMQRLQGEVDFYQRLSGTSGSQEGLAVYELELQTTASPQVYRFVLTLTQNLRRSAIVSGTASLELEGTRQDQAVTLKWKDLSSDNAHRPEFRFKYFQQLDGYLTVPEDFEPERIRVALNAKGSNKALGRDFSWTDLVQPVVSAPLPAELEKDAGELETEVATGAKNP